MEALFQLGVLIALLLLAYFTGSHIEKKHFADLDRREQRHRQHIATTMQTLPDGTVVARVALVTGSVVVSLDYFKRFLAGLRGIIGGRVRSYETLLDRARREAMLRMRESAITQGYDMVINVRLETSRIASTANNGRGTAGVEILAFGTAIQSARESPLQAGSPPEPARAGYQGIS